MLSPLPSFVRALLLAGLLLPTARGLAAAPAPFLEEHCMDCHDAREKKGGLNLETLSFDGAEATHARWVRIFDRVSAGEMPPPKRSRPDATAQRAFLTKLGADLAAQHTAAKGTVLRRLNRHEYRNTIRDLLGVSVEVMPLLPEDAIDGGFDNIGDALGISAIQLQRYMEAAEVALDAALHTDARPETTRERFTYDTPANATHIGTLWHRRDDGAIVLFNDGGFPSAVVRGFSAKIAGDYRVRVSGYGFQSAEPVAFALIVGAFQRGGATTVHSFHELACDAPSTVEALVPMQAGDTIKLSPQRLSGPEGTSPRKDGAAHYKGEGLAVQSVEIEGPILAQWPPRGRALLLGDLKVRELPPDKPWMRGKPGYKPAFTAESADPVADSRRALLAFLTQAFRRPVSASDAAPYLALFDAVLAKSGDFLTAMRTAAIAALCAPEFLYLHEPAGRLDDYALAARLSFFLTRTAPDAELLRLAAEKKLTQPQTLRAQTERLLAGAGLDRFIADFTDGWLNLREIDFTTPDKQLYPEFDEMLQDAMLRETRSFIRTLIAGNLSLANLIRSDFAMLNARLAEHYGVPGVHGQDMRRVQLPPGSRRGGLLTQGSILKVSANGTNTSPVIRGVWVMERIFGIAPQPPPPGTPGVEPDIRGARTVREILAAHRSMESCNGCHRAIDPPGFALESYDVIGGWRDRFRSLGEGQQVNLKVEGRRVRYRFGPPVDAAGELPTGEKFQDFAGFQELLLARQDRVAQCVAEKLLTFATGRAMGFSDRAEIARLVAESKTARHAARDIIHAAVQSAIFRSK